jgi:hypothetical protein
MMDPVVQEFRRHAGECRQMARDTRDIDSKVTWNSLADRWVRCAELAEAQIQPRRRIAKYREGATYRKAS